MCVLQNMAVTDYLVSHPVVKPRPSEKGVWFTALSEGAQ